MSKTCYIRLNRNFMDSLGTIKVNLPDTKRKNLEYSHRSKNLSSTTSSPEDSDGKDFKLSKERKTKYVDKSQISYSETSHSEFSEDASSSNDEETAEENVRRKKQKFSKTKQSKKLYCLDCDQSFSSHSSYLSHKRSHLLKQFKCSLCKTGWKYRQSFIYHMKKNHPEVEPFICEYRSCEKSFKTQKLLEMHSKIHLKYMCTYCKKLFARKYRMHKHVSKVH